MSADRYEFGEFSIDVEGPALYRGGQRLRASRKRKVLNLLLYLAQKYPSVHKSEIYKKFWPDQNRDEHLEKSLVELLHRVWDLLGDTDRKSRRYVDRDGDFLLFLIQPKKVNEGSEEEPKTNADAVLRSAEHFQGVAARPTDALVEKPSYSEAKARTRLWNVPIRNPFFTARDGYLEILHKALCLDGSTAVSQTQAISGLGGIGKTQTAIEYAHRFRENYSAAFWVSGESPGSVLSSYVSLADVLALPEGSEKDTQLVAKSVLRWMNEHVGWLLIFDNVEDFRVVGPYIPSGKGHILITTRLLATGAVVPGKSLELNTLDQFDGALLLLRRAKLISADARLEGVSPAEREIAQEITQELGGLPLALDQAGAFIEEAPATLQEYLTLYRSEGATLRDMSGEGAVHSSVTTTFSLALASVQSRNPAAADLVRMCAFLDADDIPEEVFTDDPADLGGELATFASKPSAFVMALKDATRFALVHRDGTLKTIRIHRVVQEVIRDTMDDSTLRSWTACTVRGLGVAFSRRDPPHYRGLDRYIPHVQQVSEHIHRYKAEGTRAVRLLSLFGLRAILRGEFDAAESLLIQAAEMALGISGTTGLEAATSLRDLGDLYAARKDRKKAKALYGRALAIREKVLGPEHLDTAEVLDKLGAAHFSDVMLDSDPLPPEIQEAKAMCERALAIRERVLGSDHKLVAASLMHFALLYRNQLKLSEAQAFCERALAIQEKVLGPEHYDISGTLEELALIHYLAQHETECRSLFERIFAITAKSVGPEDPLLVQPLRSYAMIVRNWGSEQEAIDLERRANAISAAHSMPIR